MAAFKVDWFVEILGFTDEVFSFFFEDELFDGFTDVFVVHYD